jgi:hypothetical protein
VNQLESGTSPIVLTLTAGLWVFREVVELADFRFAHGRGVLRFRIARDRIVAIEAGRARQSRVGDDDAGQDERGGGGSNRSAGMHDALRRPG